MAGDKENSLSLIIRAVDKLTGPLREMNAKITKAVAPVHHLGESLKGLGEESGITRLGERAAEFGKGLGEVKHEAVELGKHLLEMQLLGGFALFELFKGAVETGSQLNMMAQRVGLNVDAYAQLRFAAGQAHVTQEGFNDAMDKFNKGLGQAKAGTGSLYEFLLKVSPALAVQVRSAKDTEAALGLMTRAFTRLKDPAKIAALATEAFGRGGAQMGQFLHQGTAEIDAQRKRFFQLAGSQKEFADGSEEAEKALNETSAAFSGLKNAAITQLFPALTALTRGVTEFLASHREGIAAWAKETGAAISDWVKGGGLQRLATGLSSLASFAGRLVDAVGGMKGVFIITGAIMAGSFVGSVVTTTAALLPLAGSIAQVTAAAAAMTFGPVIASITTFVQALGLGFTALEALQLAFAPALLAAAPFVLAAGGIAAAGYEIYKNWGDLKFIAKDTWGSIVFYVNQAWDKIKPILDAISAVSGSMLFHPIDALKTAGQFYGDALGITERPTLGAAQVAGPGGAGVQRTEAKVSVDFSNLPRGARVSQDKSGDQPVDLSMGYAGVLP